MLIRLGWHWLERWHEPLVVGAAVTLMALAYLSPAATERERAGWPGDRALDGRSAILPEDRLPRNDQFYRDQWAREAKQFYTLHPPRQLADPQAGGKVLPASAVALPSGQQGDGAVAHACHADTGSQKAAAELASKLSESPPAGKAAAVPASLKRWQVATCLAAGMLASLAFAAVWPAVTRDERLSQVTPADVKQTQTVEPVPPNSDVGRDEAIAIRLPAAWVQVRPTMSQTLRRSVLGGSYLTAVLGGWAILG